MRAIIAAVLLCGLGSGCCKTCSWCHNDTPAPSSSASQPVATPTSSTQPPAPAGVPVSRPAGVGAYGGTGN